MGAARVARILKTIGDPVRMDAVCFLMRRPDSCVSEVAHALKRSVAITSHHLRELSRAGILESVPVGKQRCYRMSATPIVHELKTFICKYK